jgi:hypothetical protein
MLGLARHQCESPLSGGLAAAGIDRAEVERLAREIGRYQGEWNDQQNKRSISNLMPDMALVGNGDVGVMSGGSTGVKTFYLSRSDFWNANPEPMPAALGGVTIQSLRKAPLPADPTRVKPDYIAQRFPNGGLPKAVHPMLNKTADSRSCPRSTTASSPLSPARVTFSASPTRLRAPTSPRPPPVPGRPLPHLLEAGRKVVVKR